MRENEARARSSAIEMRKQMTHAEVLLWQVLRKRAVDGFHFRKQHPIGPYITDFACVGARIIIEVDGSSHDTPDSIRHDARCTAYLESNGWTILRFRNSDIYKNLDGVWIGIRERLPQQCGKRT